MSDWQKSGAQDTVVETQQVSPYSAYVSSFQPGDVVRNTKTYQERVVVSYRPDMGLIEFEDSNLVGWSDAQAWVPTGVRAAQ